jgi:aerobic carbon-monoxide dehydrogenase medium subunit
VTLPPFELHRPSTLDEASRLLDEHGDAAALYCGGTELLLLLKLGFASFGHLVDLKGIEELAGVRADNGTLVIGGAVTHRTLERDTLVLERLPALAEMERGVANIRVRNVGTLGGNLCFSDPHSDPGTFLLALDAEVECRRAGGEPRRVPLADFVVGPYQTALDQGEILTAVRVPLPARGLRIVHRKFRFHERPAVTVTCAARVGEGSIAEARISVGSVGPCAVRAAEAERLLAGAPVDGPLGPAAESAAGAGGAVEDANGSIEYKENLVRVLVERALREALA